MSVNATSNVTLNTLQTIYAKRSLKPDLLKNEKVRVCVVGLFVYLGLKFQDGFCFILLRSLRLNITFS